MGPPSATAGGGTITRHVTPVRFTAIGAFVQISPAALILAVLSLVLAGAMAFGALLLVG
jgi:hypothetical protein